MKNERTNGLEHFQERRSCLLVSFVSCVMMWRQDLGHTHILSWEATTAAPFRWRPPFIWFFSLFFNYDGKKEKQGGRETHYKKRNGTHTHTHVIPRRNGGCYMCVCERPRSKWAMWKKGKNRTERKGSSLLLLIRNDKGKKQKKKKKGIHFHSRYGVGWWRGKRTLVASLLPFIERRRPTPKGNAANKWIPTYDDDAMLWATVQSLFYMYGWWAVPHSKKSVPLLFFFPS